jgi:SHS family lactate transporter-like MFS transporter
VGVLPAASDTFARSEPWVGAFLAGLAGWTLDAFDFFLVVLALPLIALDFGQNLGHLALAMTATLALRPIGALVSGSLSDRFGRRPVMIVNLSLFAVVELATGCTHGFVQFLIVRALFGAVIGGQWGIGVSLAMEKVPAAYRGILSGLLQQGYSLGFLLAAGAYFLISPTHGWRPLFYLGSLPALALAGFVALRVRESEVWQQNRQSSLMGIGRALTSRWKLFAYLTVLMMAMHMSSHSTRDLYPTLLEKDWGIMGKERTLLTAVSMIGAILGGLSIGWISDHVGRRRAMIGAMLGAIAVIPLWALAHSLPLLVLGVVLMQFCVQGAWGVVPAYFSELSPDSVRGTLPGFANQLGLLLSSVVVYLELVLAKGRPYAVGMSITVALVFCFTVVMTFLGHERRAVEFGHLD